MHSHNYSQKRIDVFLGSLQKQSKEITAFCHQHYWEKDGSLLTT